MEKIFEFLYRFNFFDFIKTKKDEIKPLISTYNYEDTKNEENIDPPSYSELFN